MTSDALLALRGVQAWYGESHVLHGVDLDVNEGEVVTLLGRNGAGKTTILKTIMGLMDRREGSIRHAGVETIRLRADQVARSGIAFCPEERAIFSGLNVMENLMLPPVIAPGGMDIAAVLSLFPNLEGRGSTPGTRLSGGEQQMLAIGRILRSGARLLMLDEPTEGLAPVIVQQIGETIREIRKRGFTVLLVEQNFQFARTVADRHYVIDHGQVVDMFPNALIEQNLDKLHAYLGV